ncbi:MAG TPA: hypothetical protein VI756_15375 [Blastocatellia bacterium]
MIDQVNRIKPVVMLFFFCVALVAAHLWRPADQGTAAALVAVLAAFLTAIKLEEGKATASVSAPAADAAEIKTEVQA